MILPKLKHGSGIRTTQQVRFGGLNHTKSASEGEIYDMMNMSSKDYPLLSTRKKRELLSLGENVKAVGDRWIIKGQDFYYDGDWKNEFMPLSDTPKTVVEMGAYVLIFPDKYYYNTEEDKPFAEGVWELTVTNADGDSFNIEETLTDAEKLLIKNRTVWINEKRRVINYRSMLRDFSTEGLAVQNGNIIKSAKGFGNLQADLGVGQLKKSTTNSETLKTYFGWDNDPCRAELCGIVKGDGILIKQGEAELSLVVQEVGDDKIGFGDITLPWTGEATASRNIPDFEFMCVSENRLWGVYDGTIYASKLGDPKNFYVYQALSTDSWAVDYLSKIFTGAVTYNGKPTFWTEDSVITIYGNTPSTYQATETNLNGVLNGAGSSMAVVGGYLYYLSPQGMCVYGGRYPTDIHVPIGEKISTGFGFTEGNKYYIDTGNKMYVYDPSVHLWHIEDSANVCNYNTKDGMLNVVSNSGDLCGFTGNGDEVVDSFVEFGDFYLNTGDKKSISKLNIRIEAEEGATIDIKVKYDSEDEWQTVKVLTATAKRSFYLPFVPRRCDHYRLRFEGTGNYTIYSMSRENYIGSAN